MNALFNLLIITFLFSQDCQKLDTIKHYNSVNAPNKLFYKEFLLKKDECLDPARINRQRIRLLQSGYFESLSYLFYPKNNKIPVKFYYQEKSEFFRYRIAPYLSYGKHFGLFGSAKWDFIDGGTESYGLRFQLSTDEIKYKFLFEDPYWLESISYDFSYESNDYDYTYRDLSKNDSYRISESIFSLGLNYKLGLDDYLRIGYKWKNYKLDGGIYKNVKNSNDDDHILSVAYKLDKTDWPIFLRKGYGFSLDYRYIYQKMFQLQVYMNFATKIHTKFYLVSEFESKYNQGTNDHYHLIRFNNESNIDYFSPYELGKLAFMKHFELRYDGNLGFDPNGAKSLKNALSFSIFFNKINSRKESFKLKNLNIDFGVNIYFHIKKQIARIRFHSIKENSFFVSIQTFLL